MDRRALVALGTFWISWRFVHNCEYSVWIVCGLCEYCPRDLAQLARLYHMGCLSGVLYSFNRVSSHVLTPSAVFHPQRVEIEGGTERLKWASWPKCVSPKVEVSREHCDRLGARRFLRLKTQRIFHFENSHNSEFFPTKIKKSRERITMSSRIWYLEVPKLKTGGASTLQKFVFWISLCIFEIFVFWISICIFEISTQNWNYAAFWISICIYDFDLYFWIFHS